MAFDKGCRWCRKCSPLAPRLIPTFVRTPPLVFFNSPATNFYSFWLSCFMRWNIRKKPLWNGCSKGFCSFVCGSLVSHQTNDCIMIISDFAARVKYFLIIYVISFDFFVFSLCIFFRLAPTTAREWL